MRDELLYLDRQAFPSNCAHGEPLIDRVNSIPEEDLRQGRGGLETRGEVFIRGLWESQTDSIIDVRFGDADADPYKYEPIENLLARREKENKDNHGKH